MLFDDGGDDDYGVIRADVLRRVPPYDSYHRSDRTFMAELALHGRFYQVPEWLYFRRHHAREPRRQRLGRSARRARRWDPRRAGPSAAPDGPPGRRVPVGLRRRVARVPMSWADRGACYRHLVSWTAKRVNRPAQPSVVQDSLGRRSCPRTCRPPVAGERHARRRHRRHRGGPGAQRIMTARTAARHGSAFSDCSDRATSATTDRWKRCWHSFATSPGRRDRLPVLGPGDGHSSATGCPRARLHWNRREYETVDGAAPSRRRRSARWSTRSASALGSARHDVVIVPGHGRPGVRPPIRPVGLCRTRCSCSARRGGCSVAPWR